MQSLLHTLSGECLHFVLDLSKIFQLLRKMVGANAGSQDGKRGAASPYQVHAVALNIDDRVSNTSSVRFDADSLTVICDNSANVHICNNKSSFVGDIEMDKSLQVATIGGKQNASAGIGTV